jgi:hypothetical protein
MTAKKQWWDVNASAANRLSGERDGKIDAPTEEEAREKYLAIPAHEGWIIHTITPGDPPEKPIKPPKPVEPPVTIIEDPSVEVPGGDPRGSLA